MLPSSHRSSGRGGVSSGGEGPFGAAEHRKTTSSGVLNWMPTPLKTVFMGMKKVWAAAEEPELEARGDPAFTRRAGLSLDEAVHRRDDEPNDQERRQAGDGVQEDAGFRIGGRKAIETWGNFSRDLMVENGLDGRHAFTKPTFLQDHDTRKALDRLRRTKRRAAPFHADLGPRKRVIDGLSFLSPTTGSGSGGSGLEGSGGGFRELPVSKKLKVSEDKWEGKAIYRAPAPFKVGTSFKLGGRDFKRRESKPYGNEVERLFGKPISEPMEVISQGEHSKENTDTDEEGDFDLPVFRSGVRGSDAAKMNGVLKRLMAANPDIEAEACDSEVSFVDQELVVMLRNR